MAGRTSTDHGVVFSSPPTRESIRMLSPPRGGGSSSKEKRKPSITPRKFRRFFTPRSSRVPSQLSPARKALRDLGAPELNHRYQTPAPSSPLKPMSEHAEDEENFRRLSKRRKMRHTPSSSPCGPLQLPSSDLDNVASSSRFQSGLLSPIRSLKSSQESMDLDDDEEEEDSDAETEIHPAPVRRIAPLTSRGLGGQLLQRQLGGMPRAGRSYMSYPAADWRTDAADFYSSPADVHTCGSNEGPGQCIPFCTATCNTNSLTAVGDEEGRVRLLDTSSSESFNQVHVCFQAHSNAIIDLAFSNDDYLLATASGDQTGRVIDMMTQTPVALLEHHTASLKQVRFQPGKANKSVLATSSRDGSVQIWDLRCTGGPVQEVASTESRESGLRFRRPQPKQGCAVNSIYHAHARTLNQYRQAIPVESGDTPSRAELPGRMGDVSVTALEFLPEGQEHLLLTACEADASIKLWDVRSIHTSRHKTATPLSATTPPTSHSHWRPFGISSLALNTDGSRLYAVCKDNTIYTYSTAHLILGHSPELSTRNGEPPRRRHGVTTQTGLGPIYGFRHPAFHATSFYVKSAVRPKRDGRSEMLAVGSNDGCAVLFPTEERYFRDDLAGSTGSVSLEDSTVAGNNGSNPSASSSFSSAPMVTLNGPSGVRRSLFRANSSTALSNRIQDNIPIVRKGAPLIRGHSREVGALSWTHQGELVTVGDDYLIRCWREGREQAADIRTGGESEGRRWRCGWADVGADWDRADDDDDDDDDE